MRTTKSYAKGGKVAVLAVILALIAAACSSTDSTPTTAVPEEPATTSEAPPTSSDTGGPDTTAAPDVEESLRIGVIYPQSGPFAFQGEATITGAQFAAQQINEMGGIESLGGAQLELVEADAGESPESAAAATNQLIESEDLTAMIGAWLGSYSAAMAPLAERAQLPYVTEAFGDDITDQGFRYLNDIDPRSSVLARLLMDGVVETSQDAGQPIERVVLGGDNSFSAVPLMDALREGLPERGIEILADQQWTSPLQDTSAFVSEVVNEDPDAVILIAFAFSDVSNILSSLRGAGYSGPVIQNGGQALLPTWLEAGDEVLGLITQVTYGPIAGAEEISQAMAEFAQVPYVYQDHFLGYVNIWAIKEGLEAAGSTEGATLTDAIRNLEVTEGPLAQVHPLGSFSFDDTGRVDGDFAVLQQWQSTDDGPRPCVIWPLDRKTCEIQLTE